MALGIIFKNISNKNNNSIEYMHFYKQVTLNDDFPNDDFKKKLDEILEIYLYKYIESY
jgi:hypothetical protein